MMEQHKTRMGTAQQICEIPPITKRKPRLALGNEPQAFYIFQIHNSGI
jgi:hypothetical protein